MWYCGFSLARWRVCGRHASASQLAIRMCIDKLQCAWECVSIIVCMRRYVDDEEDGGDVAEQEGCVGRVIEVISRKNIRRRGREDK